MPAPHTTAVPQCGSRSCRPARKIANVSLMTVLVGLQPIRRTASASSSSSSGRSALARQATVFSTGIPLLVTCLTSSSSTRTVGSAPASWELIPPPRAEAMSVPSMPTRATSVLLLPPSKARTAASGALAKAGRAQGEGEQGTGGVVIGRLDRWPGDRVVFVGGRLGVERGVVAGTACLHAAHGAEPGEVGRAAGAVGGRPQLGQAGHVGDLALHAKRVSAARAHHERAAPGVGAEREVQLLLR